MISTVRGTVLALTGSGAIIEVGGVGLAVALTPTHSLSLRVGGEAFVHTALIVREDELSLYGFTSRDELELFDLLRGVSGVGPRSALGVLATLSPDEVARAVAAEDDAPFRKVSGIGPKTAKLITVSLAGKLAPPAGATTASASPVAGAVDASVITALVGLGWPERVAAQAVSEVVAESGDENGNAQALLRLALSRLGPQRVGSTS